VEAIQKGDAVAIVGSGLSIGVGGPSWDELILGLAAEAQDTQPQDLADIASALEATVQGRYLDAASVLKRVLGEEFPSAVRRQLESRSDMSIDREACKAAAGGDAVTSLFTQRGPRKARSMAPALVHRLISRMGFKAIVTTNYDDMIEQGWGRATPPVYQWSNPHLGVRVQSGASLILKAHGDFSSPGDIILTREEYASARYNDRAREALKALLSTNACLWLGYGHNDPDLDLLWDECRARLGKARGYGLALRRDIVLQARLRGAGITPTLLSSHADLPLFIRKIAENAGVPIVFAARFSDTQNTRDSSLQVALLLGKYGNVDLWPRADASCDQYFEAERNVVGELRRLVAQPETELARGLAQLGVIAFDGLLLPSSVAATHLLSTQQRLDEGRAPMPAWPVHNGQDSPPSALGGASARSTSAAAPPPLSPSIQRTPSAPLLSRALFQKESTHEQRSLTGSPPVVVAVEVPLDLTSPPHQLPMARVIQQGNPPLTPWSTHTPGKGAIAMCYLAVACLLPTVFVMSGLDAVIRDSFWRLDSQLGLITFAALTLLAAVMSQRLPRRAVPRGKYPWFSAMSVSFGTWVTVLAASLFAAELWAYTQTVSVAHAQFKEDQIRREVFGLIFDSHAVWICSATIGLGWLALAVRNRSH